MLKLIIIYKNTANYTTKPTYSWQGREATKKLLNMVKFLAMSFYQQSSNNNNNNADVGVGEFFVLFFCNSLNFRKKQKNLTPEQ